MSNVSHGIIIQGVIHGKTIVLAENPGIADGQAVEVVVRAAPALKAGAIENQSAAGMLADYPDMDADMEEILRERTTGVYREIEE